MKIAVVADPQVSFSATIVSCDCAFNLVIVHIFFLNVHCSFLKKGSLLQLMDSTSLGLPSSSIALQAAEFYTDLNMRRSFQSAILPFKPDVVLFLGDHFDGGPYMSDEE